MLTREKQTTPSREVRQAMIAQLCLKMVLRYSFTIRQHVTGLRKYIRMCFGFEMLPKQPSKFNC